MPSAGSAADAAHGAGAGALDGIIGAYPGDHAPRTAIAAWMGDAAQRAGLPRELPVMAALVESGLKNDRYGDRDSLGFFQMRTSIWNHGKYAGFSDDPRKQLRWFIDEATALKATRMHEGVHGFGSDPHKLGRVDRRHRAAGGPVPLPLPAPARRRPSAPALSRAHPLMRNGSRPVCLPSDPASAVSQKVLSMSTSFVM